MKPTTTWCTKIFKSCNF